MQNYINHALRWNDTSSLNNIRKDMKYSDEVIKAEITNILLKASMIFQYKPAREVLMEWASMLVKYKKTVEDTIAVCDIIPTRFDKFPSFNEFYCLYQSKKEVGKEWVDPEAQRLNDTYVKYCRLLGEESLGKLGQAYKKKVLNLGDSGLNKVMSDTMAAKLACMDIDILGVPKTSEEWASFWLRAKQRHENILKKKFTLI